ncbi:unnamed protein product [Amoebophrya sp. A120]|nr:unnamed protein product [Amoebophrya sp. A120]|eukprot:GSA120T00001344001.1
MRRIVPPRLLHSGGRPSCVETGRSSLISGSDSCCSCTKRELFFPALRCDLKTGGDGGTSSSSSSSKAFISWRRRMSSAVTSTPSADELLRGGGAPAGTTSTGRTTGRTSELQHQWTTRNALPLPSIGGTSSISATTVLPTGTRFSRTSGKNQPHEVLQRQSFWELRSAFLDELFRQQFKYQLKPLGILPIWALQRTVPRNEYRFMMVATFPLVALTGAAVAMHLYYTSSTTSTGTSAEEDEGTSTEKENYPAGAAVTLTAQHQDVGTTRVFQVNPGVLCNWALMYAWMLLIGRSAIHYGLQLGEFAVPNVSSWGGNLFLSRLLPPIGFFLLGTALLTMCESNDHWRDANQLTLLAFMVQFWLYDFWNFHHGGLAPQYWGPLCMAQSIASMLCLQTIGYLMRQYSVATAEAGEFRIFPKEEEIARTATAAAGEQEQAARGTTMGKAASGRGAIIDDINAHIDSWLGISASNTPGQEPPYKVGT